MLSERQFQQIRQLRPSNCRAFVAGCAERAYDAYTYSTHPPSGKYAQALDALWESVEDPTAHTSMLAEVATFYEGAIAQAKRVAGEETLSVAAMSCLLSAIFSTLLASSQEAIAASQYLSGTAARSNRRSAEAVTEEDTWQSEWLNWCEQNNALLARDEFTTRNEARPLWVERMEAQ